MFWREPWRPLVDTREKQVFSGPRRQGDNFDWYPSSGGLLEEAVMRWEGMVVTHSRNLPRAYGSLPRQVGDGTGERPDPEGRQVSLVGTGVGVGITS